MPSDVVMQRRVRKMGNDGLQTLQGSLRAERVWIRKVIMIALRWEIVVERVWAAESCTVARPFGDRLEIDSIALESIRRLS